MPWHGASRAISTSCPFGMPPLRRLQAPAPIIPAPVGKVPTPKPTLPTPKPTQTQTPTIAEKAVAAEAPRVILNSGSGSASRSAVRLPLHIAWTVVVLAGCLLNF